MKRFKGQLEEGKGGKSLFFSSFSLISFISPISVRDEAEFHPAGCFSSRSRGALLVLGTVILQEGIAVLMCMCHLEQL